MIIVDRKLRQCWEGPAILQLAPIGIALVLVIPVSIDFIPSVVGERRAGVIDHIYARCVRQHIIGVSSAGAIQKIVTIAADQYIAILAAPQFVVAIIAVNKLARCEFRAIDRVVQIDKAAIRAAILIDDIVSSAPVDHRVAANVDVVVRRASLEVFYVCCGVVKVTSQQKLSRQGASIKHSLSGLGQGYIAAGRVFDHIGDMPTDSDAIVYRFFTNERLLPGCIWHGPRLIQVFIVRGGSGGTLEIDAHLSGRLADDTDVLAAACNVSRIGGALDQRYLPCVGIVKIIPRCTEEIEGDAFTLPLVA